MNRFRFLFLIGILSVSCSTGERSETESAEIAVSVFPVADIVQHIAGDSIRAQTLIPPGANPHTFEPQPALIKSLQSVRLYIGVNPEFDGWVLRYLPNSCHTVFLRDDHPQHGEHENPHLWLSVQIVKSLLPVIQNALTEMFPEQDKEFLINTNLYITQLDSVDDLLEQQFIGADKPFIQYHPAWDFLAKDYGLSILGTISMGHGETGSVKSFETLIRTAREQDAHIIVAGVNEESPLLAALAAEIDGQVLRLSTLGDPANPEQNSYLKLMAWNGKRLSDVLKGPVQANKAVNGVK